MFPNHVRITGLREISTNNIDENKVRRSLGEFIREVDPEGLEWCLILTSFLIYLILTF